MESLHPSRSPFNSPPPPSRPCQVESLHPQLVNAGSIRLQYPENKAADEHFENLRKQYAESISRVRDLSDEAIDAAQFIRQSGQWGGRGGAGVEGPSVGLSSLQGWRCRQL